MKLLEDETARRVEEAIRKKIEETLNSEEVRLEIQKRIAEGRKKLLEEVEVQLEKEKEQALIEARKKAVCTFLQFFKVITTYIILSFDSSQYAVSIKTSLLGSNSLKRLFC